MTSTNPSEAGQTGKTASSRPLVPYVRLVDSDNLSECPYDHSFLIQLPADLAYSRDFAGGSVVTCPLKLRFCPSCRKWFIDAQRLDALKKQGINLRGFDILDSETYPRPAAYQNWHPDALIKPAVQETKTSAHKAAGERQRPAAAAKSASGTARTATRPASRSADRLTDRNLAFRCRYCDGGQSGRNLGFRGICSQSCYFQNVVEVKDPWCSSPDNDCQNQGADLADDAERCSECHLLTDWIYGTKAGQGDKPSAPVHIPGDRTGAIALATTVLPRESETNRRIFAIFLIGGQQDRAGQTFISADPKLRLELMLDEPLYYWKMVSAKGQSDESGWEGEPYRNLNQDMIIRALYKAMRIIKDADRRAIAEYLFNRFSASVSPAHLNKLLS